MFCTREMFNSTALRQIDIPEELKEKQVQKNVTNAIRLQKQQEILSENFEAASYA